MTALPPPSSTSVANPSKAHNPTVAWLIPAAALVAVVGGVLPWFKPIGYVHGSHHEIGVQAHAWQAGAVGAIGPILLVVLGGLVLRRFLSSKPAKPGKNPVRRSGLIAILFALVTIALQGAARGLVLNGTVTLNGQSIKLEDLAGALGYTAISRGTQLGFWLTTVAAVLVLTAGVAMMIVGKKSSPAADNSFAVSNTPYRPATSMTPAPNL
jgi:uncharacterized YccA/Bax inhibitor family protein